MSLEALRTLRHRRKKPDGVVTILIGTKPAWRHDEPNFVHIAADVDPSQIDWRPLTGLWCAVFLSRTDLRWLGAGVLDALRAVDARVYGGADPEVTMLCIEEPSEKHQRNLRATWELLCQ